MFPSRQSSVELKLLMHSLHREKYQDFPLEGSKQDLLTTIIFLNTVNLPQRLVEGEAREVEETQVLFCHHAVKVVTAEKKRINSSIRGQSSETRGSVRPVLSSVQHQQESGLMPGEKFKI